MFTVLRSMKKRSINVYSTQKYEAGASWSKGYVYNAQKLFLVILVVRFTVVIFGQIQCKKINVYSSRHFWSCNKVISGHLYSDMLTILNWIYPSGYHCLFKFTETKSVCVASWWYAKLSIERGLVFHSL